MDKLKNLESKTKEIYNSNAEEFDQQRLKNLYEKKWLDLLLNELKEGDEILDVGCGAGEPIARYFIEKGMKVTGVDFSTEMIRLAAKRFPQNEWFVQDMRELKLNRKFKAIIAWNSFFHLTQDDQLLTFSLFHKHLLDDGIILLTVGHEKGEITGRVNNNEVYHSSLSPEGYKELIKRYNLTIIDFVLSDLECNGHTVLLAKKSS
jgi:cyclopropane fatty-acyl-phospholipid synthase-like methyltransferase